MAERGFDLMAQTQQQQREIAMRAARSYVRQMGIDPFGLTAKEALRALDDLARIDRATVAARWYVGASDNQIRLFSQEWKRFVTG